MSPTSFPGGKKDGNAFREALLRETKNNDIRDERTIIREIARGLVDGRVHVAEQTTSKALTISLAS